MSLGFLRLSWLLGRRESLEDIVLSDGFWLEQQRVVTAAVRPLFRTIFLAGGAAADAEQGAKSAPPAATKELDVDAFGRVADVAIDAYTNEWWQRIEEVTRRQLRDVVKQARDNGWQPKETAAKIAPLFGSDRAMGIAITETTNLMGAGAQAQYRFLGYSEWEWRTASDSRVCPRCGPKDGASYPMNVPFGAEHPGCRCWPVPSGEPAEAPATI